MHPPAALLVVRFEGSDGRLLFGWQPPLSQTTPIEAHLTSSKHRPLRCTTYSTPASFPMAWPSQSGVFPPASLMRHPRSRQARASHAARATVLLVQLFGRRMICRISSSCVMFFCCYITVALPRFCDSCTDFRHETGNDLLWSEKSDHSCVKCHERFALSTRLVVCFVHSDRVGCTRFMSWGFNRSRISTCFQWHRQPHGTSSFVFHSTLQHRKA